jgi:hypothetical protein
MNRNSGPFLRLAAKRSKSQPRAATFKTELGLNKAVRFNSPRLRSSQFRTVRLLTELGPAHKRLALMRISRLLSLTALFLAAISLNGAAFAQGGGGGNTGGGGGFNGGGNTGGGGFGGGGNTGGGGFGGGGNTGGGGGFNGGGNTGGGSSFGTTSGGGTGSLNSGSNGFGGGTTGGTSQGTSGGTSGGGGATNSSQPLNLDNQLNITPTTPTAVDERNQGFIGPNAQQIITQGFVGASTQLSGAQPANGTSFGGGVNTQGAGAGGTRPGGGVGGAQGLRATGAAGGLGRNAMGGLGGFGGGATAGVRRNVRNRLVNQVQVNRVPAAEVAQRFTTRLDRIPLAVNAGNDVKIALDKGTAVLTGSVPSSEAASRIERQLRLEPGVYKIDNRLEVNR